MEQISQYANRLPESQRTSVVAFDGRNPRTEWRELDSSEKRPGTDLHQALENRLRSSSPVSSRITTLPPAKPHITLCQMRMELVVSGLPNTPSTVIPGAEMPTKAEEAEELAARLGVDLSELPDRLVAMKEQLNEYADQVNRFAQMFQSQPVSRRMRRAQRFRHSRLHG